jgi:hypothetical protein
MINRLMNELHRTSSSNPAERQTALEKAGNALPDAGVKQSISELYQTADKGRMPHHI